MSSKVVVITGATSGIGKASLERLAAEGHTVYGTHRKPQDAEGISAAGGRPLELDMTDSASLERGVAHVIAEQGRIDALFNNAGYGVWGAVEDVPIDEARRQFEVNLFGLARITQLALPHMRKQGSGLIINNSSIGGRMYSPLGAWYHATKHALEGWSDCLRIELRPFGIDVVLIEPGLIATSFFGPMLSSLAQTAKGGAYEKMSSELIDSLKDAGSTGSPPTVIAELVAQAVAAPKPKTRYAAGQMATSMLLLRKLASDRMFDKIIMSRLNVS